MQILRVVVGSRAHGLATPESDWDYRSVFVTPTSQLVGLGPKPRNTEWKEADKAKGEQDDVTGWEVGHFLHLALQSNPSILEVFVAPPASRESIERWGLELCALFPYVWHPQAVYDAFTSYGRNQQKKMLAEETFSRWRKYGQAWIRVLWQAEQLLLTGTLPIDFRGTEFESFLLTLRAATATITMGDVVDVAKSLEERVKVARQGCEHQPNPEAVNEFLLRVRKEHW